MAAGAALAPTGARPDTLRRQSMTESSSLWRRKVSNSGGQTDKGPRRENPGHWNLGTWVKIMISNQRVPTERRLAFFLPERRCP